jgi:hypothetical protein
MGNSCGTPSRAKVCKICVQSRKINKNIAGGQSNESVNRMGPAVDSCGTADTSWNDFPLNSARFTLSYRH